MTYTGLYVSVCRKIGCNWLYLGLIRLNLNFGSFNARISSCSVAIFARFLQPASTRKILQFATTAQPLYKCEILVRFFSKLGDCEYLLSYQFGCAVTTVICIAALKIMQLCIGVVNNLGSLGERNLYLLVGSILL